ncbi:MAG: hypothetical protein PUB10_04665 [Clostridiales bacterium]|nr:hypothetical protein [Clostridiales bacterium]
MRHFYRGLAVVIAFVVSFAIFSGNIREVTAKEDKTVVMQESQFPILTVETMEHPMNQLHGFRTNLDANLVRESMTPVDQTKKMRVYLDEAGLTIRKINYELRTLKDNSKVEEGTVETITQDKENKKYADITLESNLDQGSEYAFKMTAVTSSGKKIRYYTRIKYYGTECYLAEKLDFITSFHQDSMDKDRLKNLSNYLEPDANADNSSLAYVDIHSSLDNIGWGNLSPVRITEPVPTVKEFNIETASVELDYFVKADAGSSKEEYYRVKEFYRVRYTSNRIYLLNYSRTMEALFDIDLASTKKSELKLGISNQKEMGIFSNENNTRIAFVRQGSLWSYNMAENQAVKVFSFLQDNDKDYVRNAYDQYDIQILNLDEGGDIDFMVYGYMNRGDYEGRVGIVLYHYYAGEERIEEEAYLPMETTFQILKEDVDQLGYVSSRNVFYFVFQDTVYSYNLVSKKLDTLAKDISSKNFQMSKEGKFLSWQNESDPAKSTEITILDMDTEEIRTVKADAGETIRILGTIDNNLLYGLGSIGDITKTQGGSQIVPLSRLFIVNSSGEVLKEYKRKNCYVTQAKIEDNVIHLTRVKKSGNGYKEIKDDSILNQKKTQTQGISLTQRVTKKALTELYIDLPNGFEMDGKPKYVQAKTTVVTDDTTLFIDHGKDMQLRYYVYAYGKITGVYQSCAKAIVAADDQMGVVVASTNQLVWERGGSYLHQSIESVTPVYTGGGVNSIGASLAMLLQVNGVTCDAAALSSGDASIYEKLKDNMSKQPVNLTGCSLTEVLYFVSGSRPVIAMKGTNQAVLITGYDETHVTYIDPAAHRTVRTTISQAEKMFEEAGSLFISYLP